MIRPAIVLAAAFMLLVPISIVVVAQDQVPAYVTAAVNDAARPAEDREVDAVRQPLDTVTFSTMKPGDIVADFLAGGGYYTRIFSKLVGAEGKVYAIITQENREHRPTSWDAVNAIAADPGYSNVEVTNPSVAAFSIPETVDVFWTSNNYHDLRNRAEPDELLPFNEAVFAALRPGGVFLFIDHRAADGTPAEDRLARHRIDRETVVSDMTRAGFVLDAESDAMARPEDDMLEHAGFEHSQLILRFRKPE